MSQGAIPIQKAIPIIVVTWVISLVTTFALVYFAPFMPIGTNQIGDSAITSNKIADSAIITAKLANDSITSAQILDGTLTAVDLADGSVLSVKVANGAITTAKIADGSISTAKIGDGVISTAKIADNAIVTVKFADGSVTSAKILDGTITAADLATGAVTAMKIADGAVTTDKIGDYAVTNLKLAANAIPFNFTYAQSYEDKTTSNWENITGMEVTLTLERNSTLLIMFSTEARISLSTATIHWHVLVNATYAHPGTVYLQPASTGELAPISYNFYLEGLTPGQYTIYMQWSVTGGATGHVEYRTLAVIALPE